MFNIKVILPASTGKQYNGPVIQTHYDLENEDPENDDLENDDLENDDLKSDDLANFCQTDLFWHEKHYPVIVFVDLRFVLQK